MKANGKYRAFPLIALCNRQWPNQRITKAPRWLSACLRDGNQALPKSMNVADKLEWFQSLVACGFKEIEVGFPSANQTEFDFVRLLIEGGHISDDVTIQVLVPARQLLIARTVDSLVGAKRAIVHLYNSTSPLQRRVVFGLDKPEIVELARSGAQWIKEGAARLPDTKITLQYSPESFSATEVDFAVLVCQAVMDVWQPTPAEPLILNLPATVETATPNVYADQIELFTRLIGRRDSFILSVHAHNDRGTGVAATELGLLAGAERVEGTLFGNGERTGNVDLVIVALNLYTQGIDPGLDFSRLDDLVAVYERVTGMKVPARQPYTGRLVHCAFSGSHQDAIAKGLRAQQEAVESGEPPLWDVPYLPIDPADLGREYEPVIRVNAQSGKGGIAYVLESACGLCLPKDLQREFGQIANGLVDTLGREVAADELRQMFWREFVERAGPYQLETFQAGNVGGVVQCQSSLVFNGQRLELVGEGNGPVAAFVQALERAGQPAVQVVGYHHDALAIGSEAEAIAYIRLLFPDGTKRWGVGVNANSELASIRAITSALNRH